MLCKHLLHHQSDRFLVATPQSFESPRRSDVGESVDIELATTRVQSRDAEASSK